VRGTASSIDLSIKPVSAVLKFRETILRETLKTNTVSMATATERSAALLGKSSEPRIIFVSSRLRSITICSDTDDGARNEDCKCYRMSKAAVGMLVACDVWKYKKGFKAFTYHPGYALTDLANMREGKVKKGVTTPEGSTRGTIVIVQGKRNSEVDGFLYGEEVGLQHPW